MSRTHEYYVLCTMPEPTFKELQQSYDLFGIEVFDKSYHKYYKERQNGKRQTK